MNQRKSPVKSGYFRIIGGQWRGRKLQFPAVAGLRPTPDRVRETLFNWLADEITDARCLDLFCGSGALGLEALSRGAGHCLFVDESRAALAAIDMHLQSLGGKGETASGRLPALPRGLRQPVNLVFLDPPYALACHHDCISVLIQKERLAPHALIYCENAAVDSPVQLPPGCELFKHKKAGNVQYALFRYHALASSEPVNQL